MDDATYSDYLRLMSVAGEATSGLGALLLEYGSPATAIFSPDSRLADLPAPTQRALQRARQRWCTERRPAGAAPAPVVCGTQGAPDFVAITDPAYPAALRAIADPPPWLYVSGDASSLSRPAVAIVGSRRASASGLQLARHLARSLSGRGHLVCSGLALGIDTAAHEGALERGVTAAVLASGLDRPSPRRNLPLARRIRSAGCMLSELPPGTAPNRARFPRRNRIISGLCSATIIVEAALPSGTLHTAQAAAEQGREVYVLPWSLLHPGGRGCLRLLRDGAIPITDLDELDGFFPLRSTYSIEVSGTERPDKGGPAPATMGPQERLVAATIGDAALTAEEVQALVALDPRETLRCLTDLELCGRVCRVNGRYSLNLDDSGVAGNA
jgi:DNA processing protein